MISDLFTGRMVEPAPEANQCFASEQNGLNTVSFQ